MKLYSSIIKLNFFCVYLFAFVTISFSFPIWLWQNGHEINCIEKKRIIVEHIHAMSLFIPAKINTIKEKK